MSSSLFNLRHSFNNDLLNVSTNVIEGVILNANEGFILYDPQMESNVYPRNPPLVRQVYSVSEDSVLYQKLPFAGRPETIDPIRIIQGTRVLQFLAQSNNYKGENQFRYILRGFDEGFGEWTNTPVKEYTNLRAGDYDFVVQTMSYAGEIVESDPLRLVVSPPFYKSLWAKIIYALLALLFLVFLYIRLRSRFRVEETEMVKARTQELEKKQSELKELKQEKVKSELRHVNNLLAASTMNLVVKNEFIENIKEEIKSIKSREDVSETRRALNRIIKEIDTTLKVQEDWKQFEHHFDRVHGDFLSRLTSEFKDLTPGEQKLCAFLRLNMDTKEVANLLGISIRGVEVARYRLRKKLGLDTYQNLSKFILEY